MIKIICNLFGHKSDRDFDGYEICPRCGSNEFSDVFNNKYYLWMHQGGIIYKPYKIIKNWYNKYFNRPKDCDLRF